MLSLDPSTGDVEHRSIRDLPECLPPRALLVANDTRVIRARLRGRRPTGGAVEVLLVREIGRSEKTCRWIALAQANKPVKLGDTIELGGIKATVTEKRAGGEVGMELDVSSDELVEHMEAEGEVPLPPYIRRPPVPEDKERYQTVFARLDGSVAAPTAGLHFTNELIEKLAAKGIETVFVTLHVGPGTFRPVKAEDTDQHKMDGERYVLGEKAVRAIKSAKAVGRPVIAVGTTVTRALEGAFAARGELEACSDETDLFIAPGFEFRVIDGLFTNFHLPRSTLLCLVSALAGREKIMAAYGEAINMRYRFYSYGDAMLILPGRKNG
jgi:S-adenosylmethionine:tRNA ribosyltransferase-isomerase